MRRRPIITVEELVKFLNKVNPKAKVFIAPSILNLDEPVRTQEFIDWERKIKCVAIEVPCQLEVAKTVTLGYAEE